MAALAVCLGCGQTEGPAGPPQKLSEWGLFEGTGADQRPRDGVVAYDVNSALFSDYTTKHRFVRLPTGTAAGYDSKRPFKFPQGTVVAKTFAIARDARNVKSGARLLETRILEHAARGWEGWSYRWNEEQTEAVLALAGGSIDVEWTHADGKRRTNQYLVPNANQCKGCHKVGGQMQPIGLKARHLNRDCYYPQGRENQLAHWTRVGLLAGAPKAEQAPRLADWEDKRGASLDARARAWLEINCAHCHQPGGAARNSALDLTATQREPIRFGVMKPPVAAGRGSGGLAYDIVPGKPEQSILFFRIQSTDPDVMMPELGKRLVHEEGVQLIREWIAGMDQRGVAHEAGLAAASLR